MHYLRWLYATHTAEDCFCRIDRVFQCALPVLPLHCKQALRSQRSVFLSFFRPGNFPIVPKSRRKLTSDRAFAVVLTGVLVNFASMICVPAGRLIDIMPYLTSGSICRESRKIFQPGNAAMFINSGDCLSTVIRAVWRKLLSVISSISPAVCIENVSPAISSGPEGIGKSFGRYSSDILDVRHFTY